MKGSTSFPVTSADHPVDRGAPAITSDDARPSFVVLGRTAADIHVGTAPDSDSTGILAAILYRDIIEAADGAVLAVDDIPITRSLTGAARRQVVDRDFLRAINQDRGGGPARKIYDRRVVTTIEGDVIHALKHDVFVAHTAYIDDVGGSCVVIRKRPDGGVDRRVPFVAPTTIHTNRGCMDAWHQS